MLPLTPVQLAALRAATRMQAEEQLAAGPTYERSGYVVVDRLGRALPARHGVRLLGCRVCEGERKTHPAARGHTHLRRPSWPLEHNVPVAGFSAWLGHGDTAVTMRTYVHNQPERARKRPRASIVKEAYESTQ